MNLNLEYLEDKGFYINLFEEEDSLGREIAVGDVLLAKDKCGLTVSVYVAFIHRGEWIAHPLYDLNIQAYEDLNGIKYAERDGGVLYLSLKSLMKDNEVKQFGNIFDIHQFAEYIVNNDDYDVFNKLGYYY